MGPENRVSTLPFIVIEHIRSGVAGGVLRIETQVTVDLIFDYHLFLILTRDFVQVLTVRYTGIGGDLFLNPHRRPAGPILAEIGEGGCQGLPHGLVGQTPAYTLHPLRTDIGTW